MKKSLLLQWRFIACLVLLVLNVFTPEAKAQTQIARTIPAPYTINNMTGFYEALPVDYATSGKNYPLIIFLHGAGELAGKNATSVGSAVLNNGTPRLIRDGKFPASFTVNGKTFSFIVITPQFKEWPGSADVFKLLDYLKTVYRIDLNRIYVTGLSMGGGVTWGALSEDVTKAKQIAASVVVCGAWNPKDVPSLPANIAKNNIPVWATHNKIDPTVPWEYSQGWVDGINAAIPADKYPPKLTFFTSNSHDAWTKTYDPNFKEGGLNVYEWMLQYALNEDGPTGNPPPQTDPNAPKRISVPSSSANIIYYDNAMTQLGVKPGDTLCIPPGDYEYIHFGNLTGTADKPIIITNCGGLVRVGINSSATAASFVLSTCKYFKVEGTGASSITYGFDVNGTNKNGMKMFGFFFGNGTTDFEVHHAFVHDAGMFLQAKTLQTCAHPEWLDGAFVMRNVKIHDLLCRNSAWEGFYIGNTHYLFDEGGCTNLKSHRIANLQVYNNDLQNMGSDGIQISLADQGDNRVYNNRVVNYAMARNSPHAYGILCGGGSTLRIYNNFVNKGFNSGIEIFGSGINYVYNNVITDVYYEGINCSDKLEFEPATAYIYNNTITNTGVNGIKIYADLTTVGHKIYNNIIVAEGTQWDRPMNGMYIQGSKPILYEAQNNLNYKTIADAGFQDAANMNFRLKAGSTAIDAGRNMSDMALTTDYDNKTRPFNNTYDVGAFEYDGTTVSQFTIANAGEDKQIVAPATSAQLDGTKSTSTGGTIQSYSWKKIAGPAATIAIPNAATTQVTSMTPGNYVFELTVTDNNGGKATDRVDIQLLSGPNKAPSVDAGADITLTQPQNSTQLTGSNSVDLDGMIVSYLWEKISGPDGGVLEDKIASNTNLTGLNNAGTYVYQLTCVDNGGIVATDRVTIIVQGAQTNKAPVANAGTDQTITLPAGTVTLDGTLSKDDDGTIVSYTWKKLSGPTGGTLSAPAASKTNVTALAAGTYVFELTVKDDDNATATAQVKLIVKSANQAPVANAGTDQTITLPAGTVTLDASLSKDTDGTISTYSWKKVSGPAGGTLSAATTSKTNVTDLAVGTYVFELTVTDNENATATAQVKLIVQAANVPPVANAGSDQTITLPAGTVTLNGSQSKDSDGTIASYSWKKVSGPTGGTLSTPAAASTNVTDLAAGTYVFELTVTDNKNATATAQVKLIVNAAANKTPIANAGNDVSLTLPNSAVTLDGSLSKDDDGTISTYSWRKVSGPTGGTLATPNAAKTNVTGLSNVGEYVFELTVTDNKGATGTDQVKITVNAANKPPVSLAGSNIEITLPATSAQLNGSSSYDPDGTIAAWNWRKISGPVGGNITSPNAATTAVTNMSSTGEYIFQLTVKDNSGDSAVSQVTVFVVPAANIPPVARTQGDLTITLPDNKVTLDATRSTDEDGSITAYAWRKTSGPNGGTIASSNASITDVTSLQAGVYIFELRVTDDRNSVSITTVKVTVQDPAVPENKLPVAVTQGDLSVELPVGTVRLNGASSYDPDGNITAYQWAQVSGPNNAIIGESTSASAVVSNLVVGNYVFSLTVKDNKQAEGSSTFTLHVKDDIREQDTIMVYPNPAKEFTKVNIVRSGMHNVTFFLYDLNGKLWLKTTASFGDSIQKEIRLGGMPDGYYLLNVVGDNNETWKTEKILKLK